MKQEALKTILGMMAVGVLITLTSGSVLAVMVVAVASYMLWHAAKGLDG
jgi:hypothetical protein